MAGPRGRREGRDSGGGGGLLNWDRGGRLGRAGSIAGWDAGSIAGWDAGSHRWDSGDAFILWDTYGFPMDLTQLMAEERGLDVDVKGFNEAMEEARERARNARGKVGDRSLIMEAEATAELQKQAIPPTDEKFKYIWHEDHTSTVKALLTDSGFVDRVCTTEAVGLVLESTSFYAEQGGQIFDTGLIEGSKGVFEVRSVQVYGGYVLHVGSLKKGGSEISLGDDVVAKVDYQRRTQIAPNHTCTHLLNYALKTVLGDHIDQKGSLVADDKLRFDFSHGKPVDSRNLQKIESIVVQQIKDELPIYAKEASLVEAKRILGLRAVFGEVYPDPVRVIAVGHPVEDLLKDPENPMWASLSTEFCGGTHLSNTKEAKAFVLISEEGIAKGIRRITAFTYDRAAEAIREADACAGRIAAASNLEGLALEKEVSSLKSFVDAAIIPAVRKSEFRGQLAALQERIRKAQKAEAEKNLQKAIKIATDMAEQSVSKHQQFCILQIAVGLDTNAIREAITRVMNSQKDLAVMIFSVDEVTNKALVYAGVPETIASRGLVLKDWLSKALQPINGKGGGGKGGLAQGQGSNGAGIEAAMDAAKKYAAELLSR
ncbi:hypothetical protein L7F22_000901 [Adiantum nelumboides]|nr:hypothetical protein [Adiantum nelumboides]